MQNVVPFHFLLLSAGECLKAKSTIVAQDVQNIISLDENFYGVRPSMEECQVALDLLNRVGFLDYFNGVYSMRKIFIERTIIPEPAKVPEYVI